MKRFFLMISAVILLGACSSDDDKQKEIECQAATNQYVAAKATFDNYAYQLKLYASTGNTAEYNETQIRLIKAEAKLEDCIRAKEAACK